LTTPCCSRSSALAAYFALPWLLAAAATAHLKINSVEPTPLFPKAAVGQPLKQRAMLHLANDGAPVAASVTIRVGDKRPYSEDLGTVPAGTSAKPISILDIASPAKVKLSLYGKGSRRPLDTRELVWQPQKKWKIFSITYCHHDLGYGDYPHRLRTTIRHANIELPLKFCAATDGWDDDSKFRFVIETGEPITSFLSTHSENEGRELARRIREGRIQIGALHSTVNTEQLGHELLARLFYISGRHARDLLGVPQSRTAQMDDVIGLTWPLATALKEAGVPYLFHGHNSCARSLQPAQSEPVFYWQAPDGDVRNQALVRSTPYSGIEGDSLGAADEAGVRKLVTTYGAKWPFASLLAQDGNDFQLVTMDNAVKIHVWNRKYAYPHLICATLDMFFDDLAAELKPGEVKTFAKDGNNQWADQDATDAWLLGLARKTGENVPTAEKFSTFATVLGGGGYPWVDLYQAYHRLLTYHEHTNAIHSLAISRAYAQRYETELVENREMVMEAEEFTRRALDGALEKLTSLITTDAEANVVVFNPLAWPRSGAVKLDIALGGARVQLVDTASGGEVPCQRLAGAEVVFIANDVPPAGYKTFRVLPAAGSAAGKVMLRAGASTLENRFYRVVFDPATGAIMSIRDKDLGVELVDSSAPHAFNEYLYERYETARREDPSRWYRLRTATLSPSEGPVAATMTITGTAVGVESLRQSVTLYNDLKRIDFALDLVKSPSGRNHRSIGPQNKESVYVALPLAIPQFEIRHELPGAVVEPIRQQFAGSATAYYAVRHFTDISNHRYGVTVSSPEVALVEYGRPRSCAILPGHYGDFESILEYPVNSRLYLYLMDNMFDTNVRVDQRGRARFTWSMRSHAGNWQVGEADRFGWETLNPLLPRLVKGRQTGPLPGTSSFVAINQPNVACTTIKPAEANGAGLILRFEETRGVATTATVSLPFFGQVTRATETSLVEDDRGAPLAIGEGNRICFGLRPFGIQTIRVISRPAALPVARGIETKPVFDMEIEVSWRVDPSEDPRISHYNVYRGSEAGFQPTLLNRVGTPAASRYLDRPQLNYGGWINRQLEPDRTYYYRVAAVDRWNNEGPVSGAVAGKTLKTSEGNAVPLRVEALRAIVISPLTPHNYVNLLFRTSPEQDVRRYEIHRSTRGGFVPGASTLIGYANADSIIAGSRAYGHVPADYRMGAFDHMMYQDASVLPSTTYYYRVCAVDDANQRGPCSEEAEAQTKDYARPHATARAQSIHEDVSEAGMAIDGTNRWPWISAPFGGGTKAQPRDTWLEIQLPRMVSLRGVKLTGRARGPASLPGAASLPRRIRVEYRRETAWTTLAEVHDAGPLEARLTWAAPLETDSLRIYFPAQDLPAPGPRGVEGAVGIAELFLILPDGTELAVPDLPGTE
jgi:hypothetical protein